MQKLTSLTILLSILYPSVPAKAREALTKAEIEAGGDCYDATQVKQISYALNNLEVCQKTLKLRENFIEVQRLGTPPPLEAWWQAPTVVIGGIVVGVSVGSLLTFLVLRDK